MLESMPAVYHLVAAVPFVVAVVVLYVAVRRTLKEPRRLSNAYWLLAGAVFGLNAVGTMGFVQNEPLVRTIAVITLLSPLLILVLACFLLLNGVVMLRRERVSLANSLSLLAGMALVGLIGVTIPVLLSDSSLLRAGWLFGVLATGYLAFQFVAFVGYAWLYSQLVRGRPVEWVTVLGSGLRAGTEVPPLLASRVRAGMTEFSRRGARFLVMSGGQGHDEDIPEAEAMARWAIDNGADPAAIRREAESRNTEQNLRFSSALVRDEKTAQMTDPDALGDVQPAGENGTSPGLIVTSNYHVLRTATLARKIGVDAQVTGSTTAGYYWPSAMIREFVAILRERWLLHLTLLALVALPLPLVIILAPALS